MSGVEAAVLIVLALGAGYFIYFKEFKQSGCGCGKKSCSSKKKDANS